MRQLKILLIIILALNIWGCSDEELDDIQAIRETVIVPSIQAKETKVFAYDSRNRLTTIIIGTRKTLFKRAQEIWLDNLRTLYISREGDEVIYTELTSDKAKVNYDSLDLEAWGNVVVKRDKEMRLETERIFWDNAQEILYTEGEERVIIYKQEATKDRIVRVVGTNLHADKKLSEVELDEVVTLDP